MSATRTKIPPDPMPAEMPPAFDRSIYAGQHEDLAGFDEAGRVNHYERYGRDEGRISSVIGGRVDFLNLIPPAASLLEIGPFCTPCFTTRTHKVRFLDAFPTAELRKIVGEHSWGRPDLVPEIDYVWRGEPYAELIEHRFDAVFTSHNIEHQPCLVTHLQDVASVLAPGRRLFLIIPDRRYCFDHYLSESTIADVLDAFVERRRQHTARSVLEHRLMLTHNEAAAHWAGDHGPDPRHRAPDAEMIERITESMKTLAARDSYVDTHAWQFVPHSFAQLISTLNAAGLTPFKVERVYPTLWSSNEFYAVLKLPARRAKAGKTA